MLCAFAPDSTKAPSEAKSAAANTAKRKGDEEFENQLAMAMEATAAQEIAKPRPLKFRQPGPGGYNSRPDSPFTTEPHQHQSQ